MSNPKFNWDKAKEFLWDYADEIKQEAIIRVQDDLAGHFSDGETEIDEETLMEWVRSAFKAELH